MRKHNRHQLLVASDSDSSAAVLQLAVPQRPASTIPATPGTLLRHEVYPPSCILPDISQVISQPTAAVQTCSSKASCGSVGARHAEVHPAAHVSSAMTVAGCDSRVQTMGRGREAKLLSPTPCTVSSSDAGVPSNNGTKAGHCTPFTTACSPGECQPCGPSGGEQSPDVSRETNTLSFAPNAVVGVQCSGGAISSLQSQSEGGPGMQSAFVPSAMHANRGTVRSRLQSQMPCQSSTLEAVQSARFQESGDVAVPPRKVLASVRPPTDAGAMDCK